MRRFLILAFITFFTLILIPSPSSLLPVQATESNGPTLSAAEFVEIKENGWQAEYEAYFQSQFQTRAYTAEDIQRTLQERANVTGSRAAVLHLFQMGDSLQLLITSLSGPPLAVPQPNASQAMMREKMAEFRRLASDPRTQNSPQYLESAQSLYDWLIAPLESKLEADQINTLIFCVGPGLRSLPWAALHDGNQFLVEKYNISLIPGFSLTDVSWSPIQNSQVLAMGASEFLDFSPLPSVPKELNIIHDLWGGATLLNQGFTSDNLRAQRQQNPYGIVHLATHAVFRPGTADNSFIQLWDEDAVDLTQLPQLDLADPPVDLLVLSACQTAMGEPEAELGFAGLAVQAGVKTAVGSLWQVSDAGTLELMSYFYEQLRSAPFKSAALRQAQLEMIASDRYSAPYFWAGFTMIGNPW
ncbi:CHAT domain-containing protein [Candidatus Synechococcus calcipolaris G9]|uniref:CHAT domain-containing protein n=1 Tax=Candidatus Synechococcus calcipolaris G9 TaxID=1497997 RepID=A0ABT6F318_9SYNE|nr:CHAT domain-containing protein [Candidatus Synechococcus calcipolaris]MDG2992247.1 CHAT domain-containing protein [Candidatus Synechococcus calcipolaris G9]